jgi:hypothetical protein
LLSLHGNSSADARAVFVRDWVNALVNHRDFVPLSGAAATRLFERLVDPLVGAFHADPVLVDVSARRLIAAGPHPRGSADAITAALVPLAHELGLEVVAEGVESAAQADRLRDLRCDLAQGWFFARPAPTAAIEQLLTQTSTPPTAVGWSRS